jgi:uncharacterized protein
MRVAELSRYPVKSLGGERVTSVAVNERGVAGDRIWALTNTEGSIASGKATRRFRALPGLMRHRSHLDDDEPVITLADGRSARAGSPELDAVVAAIAPPGWSLQREASILHFDAGAVHVVTTATLATLSAAAGEPVRVERLRPNILLDTGHDAPFPEGEWLGRTLRIGNVELSIVDRTVRCVMVGHGQARLEPRPKLLKTIGRANQASAGVYADVIAPGTLNQADLAHVS